MRFSCGICALTVLSAVAVCQANGPLPPPLLSMLLDGQTLTEGNATYSNFQYGGTSPSSEIAVGTFTFPDGSSVIRFFRTGTVWTELDGNSVISFHVDFIEPVVQANLIFYSATAVAQIGPGGPFNAVSSVGETVSFAGGAGSLQVYVSSYDQSSVLTDSFVFPSAVTSLDVVKSIDISSDGGRGTIFATDNGFLPVPESGTLGVLGVGLVGLWRRRRGGLSG